jgi:pyruvate-formate lyase-activating enzyme
MYTVSGSALVERFPCSWSSCGASVVEAAPFYHAYPGARCLFVGTTGCNFRCRYCSNAHVAKEDPLAQQDRMYHLAPQELVSMARKLRCRCIVFNVNEPAVSIPSLVEVAREARAAAIPMGCLTNGYTTVDSTGILASVFSFFNISLKGVSDDFNRSFIGIDSVEPVLRNIRLLAREHHVEITTPVIPGGNDHEIDAMAGIIAEIDREIPWHVFRLLPEDEMKDAEYPDIRDIDEALRSARRRLPFVYFHNFVGSEWVDTLCPGCGAIVIERHSLGCGGDRLNRLLCPDGVCRACGSRIRLTGGEQATAKEGGGR